MERDPDPDPDRTVVVSGVPVRVLPAGRTADKLIIHFQSRRRSHGGDVSWVTFPTSMEGVAFVTFDRPEDAARVVKKDQQVMTDAVFPQDFPLTVFPFSTDVYFYVSSARVDLSSLDGDQPVLLEDLSSAHRSLRFRMLPCQTAAIVEGPLAAVRALGADLLLRRAPGRPNPTVPNRLKVPSKTERSSEPGGRLESPNLAGSQFLTLTVSGGNLPAMTYWDSFEKKDKLKTSAGSRTESIGRQVVGEECHPGLVPSFADLNLNGEKDINAKSLKGPIGADLSSKDPDCRRDVWLDLHTFRYVQKFFPDELDGCLDDATATVGYLEDSDLVLVSLTDQAAVKLQDLMLSWQSLLSVYHVDGGKTAAAADGGRKLERICQDLSSAVDMVLYQVKGSRVKIIGPPVFSGPFYRKLKARIEGTSLKV
ncbi:uncharacterized protein LOC115384082 [Salarias fasciatus]|uniref:uncharacterized protein LOC115384082 n=1 Tax=Salarias fasciatus TaxID=181472 RepID=UPI001176ED37|nr:RNA-binding protein 43 [Salarias fasciatus]